MKSRDDESDEDEGYSDRDDEDNDGRAEVMRRERLLNL